MENKEFIIGYTAGVFDLFHIGHLNLLKNAKGMCDKLIVGVTVDELVAYKGKNALIPFEDRIDWYGTEKWKDYDRSFSREEVQIVYFPYTKGISSTKITKALHEARGWTSRETGKALQINESGEMRDD